jgi:hypothetical protein
MHRNLPYRDAFADRTTTFRMDAGDGCFRPLSVAALGQDRRVLFDLDGDDVEVA